MQIGLALQSYMAVHNEFVSTELGQSGICLESRWSWLAVALPYMEGNAPVIPDKRQAWNATVNRRLVDVDKDTLVRTPLQEDLWPVFVCPRASQFENEAGFGLTTYIGIGGLGTDGPWLERTHPRAGIFNHVRRTTAAEIKDGLAVTVAVVESACCNGPWRAGGFTTVRGLDTSRQPYLGCNRQFGGLHGDKVMCLFADGSVRSIRTNIDGKVFEATTTIAGGERVFTESVP